MKIRKTVFYPTIIIILLFLACYMINAQKVNEILELVNQFFLQAFGWFYLVVALLLVIVSGIVLFSRFGRTKIGGKDAQPMLPTRSWFTVVLCTTIAAGLIFWGSSEPVYHLMAPPDFMGIEAGSYEASVFSMTTMFMHWTITPYAIYSVPALMFAIAVYNQKKSFSFSSCISGVMPWAEKTGSSAVIDSMCVFATVMGMIASIGQGILSIAGGVTEISGKESGQTLWMLTGILIAVVFTLSACSGVLKGIKWISNVNTVFLIFLLMLVFATGPTMYIVQLGVESFGMYLDNFFTRSLMLGAGSGNNWSYFWTVATFANWMAWAPITGIFLGKISYGHSVRKFIVVNLGAGALSSGLWISIFGGTSIYQQLHGIDLYGKMSRQGMESAVYGMLKGLSAGWLIPVLVITVALSVVTAADSTTNVLGDLCYLGNEKDRGMKLVKIVWGVLIGTMAVLLICSKGVTGIKMMSVIGGLPAAVLLLLVGISLIKVKKEETKMEEMKKIPVVMDFDTGTDDAVALITALQHRDLLNICAITAVAGNVPIEATAANTLNIVDALGHTDIPVAKGADKPLERELHCAISHGRTGLGDVIVPDAERGYYEKDAADTIYEAALAHEGELIVLATGPQTNLAIAIQRHPDIVKLIKKVYIMGGCLVGGNMTQASEFNAYVDPEAMQILFRSGLDVLMVGLDVTLQTELPIWVRDKIEAVGTPEAKLAVKIMNFMIRRNQEFGYDVANLHDVVAFCAIVNPEVLKLKKYYVDVETEGTITRGMTVADFRDVCPDKEKNITCAEDIDVESFWNWFVGVFERYGRRK